MDVAAALQVLRAADPDLALNAEGALDRLTAEEGVEAITQIGLQEFLWYRLPESTSTARACSTGCSTSGSRAG